MDCEYTACFAKRSDIKFKSKNKVNLLNPLVLTQDPLREMGSTLDNLDIDMLLQPLNFTEAKDIENDGY